MLAEIAVADPAAFARFGRNSKICPNKKAIVALGGFPRAQILVTRRFYVMLEIIKSRKNEENQIGCKISGFSIVSP